MIYSPIMLQKIYNLKNKERKRDPFYEFRQIEKKFDAIRNFIQVS